MLSASISVHSPVKQRLGNVQEETVGRPPSVLVILPSDSSGAAEHPVHVVYAVCASTHPFSRLARGAAGRLSRAPSYLILALSVA